MKRPKLHASFCIPQTIDLHRSAMVEKPKQGFHVLPDCHFAVCSLHQAEVQDDLQVSPTHCHRRTSNLKQNKTTTSLTFKTSRHFKAQKTLAHPLSFTLNN